MNTATIELGALASAHALAPYANAVGTSTTNRIAIHARQVQAAACDTIEGTPNGTTISAASTKISHRAPRGGISDRPARRLNAVNRIAPPRSRNETSAMAGTTLSVTLPTMDHDANATCTPTSAATTLRRSSRRSASGGVTN